MDGRCRLGQDLNIHSRCQHAARLTHFRIHAEQDALPPGAGAGARFDQSVHGALSDLRAGLLIKRCHDTACAGFHNVEDLVADLNHSPIVFDPRRGGLHHNVRPEPFHRNGIACGLAEGGERRRGRDQIGESVGEADLALAAEIWVGWPQRVRVHLDQTYWRFEKGGEACIDRVFGDDGGDRVAPDLHAHARGGEADGDMIRAELQAEFRCPRCDNLREFRMGPLG